MRIADSVGYLLALGKIIVLLFFLPRSRSQNFPTADEDKQHIIYDVYREELYYDLNILPDGREITDYLYKDVSKRVFYTVENKSTPLRITVTPCAAPIAWSVSRKHLPPAEEDADVKSKPRDPFLDQAFRTQLAPASKPVLLANFSGEGRHQFYLPVAPLGLYMVDLRPSGSDTYVKLHVSTQPQLPDHPQLPAQPRVQVVAASRRTVAFQWARLPSAAPVEYCVSVSRVQNFLTQCSALSHLHGDRPPRLPKDTGFGFTWEKEQRRALIASARPIKAVRRGRIFYTCLKSKTSYTFAKARPGKTYFLDVYAVNPATNMTSAYQGISVTTEERPARKRKIQLRDGEHAAVTVRREKNSDKQVQVVFRVQEKLSQALLELTSCRGKLNFDIFHRDKLVYRSTVRRRKLVHVKHMPAGPYSIQISSRRRRSKAKVYFTSNPARYKPPRLPKDRRVRAFENLTTCSNVTLAWMATRVKQRYCVYKREVTGPRDLRRLRRLSCAGPRGRRRRDRVMCVRHRAASRDRAVVTVQAQGLKPDTQYQFDVYASRGRGATRAYTSLVTRTKAQC